MPTPPKKTSAADLVRREVVDNIRNQPLGTGTVADLNLPHDLIDRIADRVTRASFNERHRLVVRDPGTSAASTAGAGVSHAPNLPSRAGSPGGSVIILDPPLHPDVLRVRRQFLETRPINRAFRADDDPASFNTPVPLPPSDLVGFKPTIARFQLLADDGSHEPRVLRLQLSRGTDYAAPGDGGSLDMLRHIAALLPEMSLVVSVERRHLADARAACEHFAADRRAPITLILQDLPIAQWAHDNGKPGLADGQPFTLVPRYASRGEDGSVFVPGESFVHEGLAAAGISCRRSPLLFQGGNMIAFRAASEAGHADATGVSSTGAVGAEGDLTLLVGESEIARNTAMGLSRERVLAAFQAEFGVVRVVVLPAISYHIDLEVSVRRIPCGPALAFVNDQPTAVRHVLHLATVALKRANHISGSRAALLRERLNRGPMNEFLLGAWSDLSQFSTRAGHVLETLAPAFSTGPADSGVGNLHRYLLALDLLAAELPIPNHVDPHTVAVLASIARRERERRQLRQQLQAIGLKTIGVPSLSDADRGINYVNGIHTRDAFLMPTYGGLFAPLDDIAQKCFASALGSNVRILPIPSGESQRREGAVRCAIAPVS